MTFEKLFCCANAAVAAVVLLGAGGSSAWAASDATCSGSIASGVYSNLKIAGACTVDKGPVTVLLGDLTVLPGYSLVATVGGFGVNPASPNLTVEDNLEVQANGTLVLGCEPIFFTCTNDPGPAPGTYATRETVGGNLTAENAYQVVVHHTAIGGNVTISGGGGGISCTAFQYGDFEDDTIGGNLTITGWQSCWLGFFRDTIMRNVNFNGNVTADPDGNEIANNTILGNLNCSGNNPSPHNGDSVGGPSTVVGNANGQCNSSGLILPGGAHGSEGDDR